MASSSPSPSFDPDRPLPAPPDPWRASDVPSVRPGPPFLMTEMIEAEPALAVRLLGSASLREGARRLAAAVVDTANDGLPIVVTGCGTSEHGAIAIADQLAEALRATGRRSDMVRSEQAFELALDPPTAGLVIGVSHEGGTAATNHALEAAKQAGAELAVVTAAGRSPAAELAGHALVLATNEVDQSWCHTVAYVSAIVAGAVVAGTIAEQPVDADAVRALLAGPLREPAPVESAAAVVARASRIVVVGSGADRAAGRELVLKLEEGAALPSAYRDLETFLHGHLAGVDATDVLVAILVDRRSGRDRADRGRQLLAAAAEVGMPAVGILSPVASGRIPPELTAARILVEDGPTLPATTAALVGT
ncbi:MAG TPA: SIS domain-containing protein, partial [Candidatus Limnocylindrales bacterium]|nr:SIS domain-containing protein [Candidatus Limnocylindrales bacterium]